LLSVSVSRRHSHCTASFAKCAYMLNDTPQRHLPRCWGVDGHHPETHAYGMSERKQPRLEAEIFSELETVCASSGYIHAIAYFCHRDNMIRYTGKMTPKDMEHLFSRERLIRTETTTLIGLMLKHDVSYANPPPAVMQRYLDRSEELLHELHVSMSAVFWEGFDPNKIGDTTFNPFSSGKALREPIFYGGESAYVFQYRDFAVRKYAKDDDWLRANRGFTIGDAPRANVERDTCLGLFKLQGRTADGRIAELCSYG
jgi:hypothetical protein